MTRHRGSAALLCLAAGGAWAGEPPGWSLSAAAVQEYRGRSAGAPRAGEGAEESDHDLRLYLAGAARSPGERLEVDASLAVWADLDGRPADGDFSALRDAHDAADGPVWFDVYTLQATWRTDGPLALARAGRQASEHGPPAVFDGGALRLRAPRDQVQLFAFGGRTVHFFDLGDDGSRFEDWIGSFGATARPIEALRIELDYRVEREDTPAAEDIVAHGYGGAAWYRPAPWLRFDASLRGLDEQLARVEAGGRAESEDGLRGLRLRAMAQPTAIGETTETEDPFSSILGPSRPHARLRAEGWYGARAGAGTFVAHAGSDSRLLLQDEPSRFNRDYGRLYLTLEATDVATQGPFATATGEYHYTHQGRTLERDGQYAAGGAVGWATPAWRAEIGSFYQRVRYTWFREVEEVLDAYVYYVEGRYRPWPWMPVRAKYELERGSVRDVHTWLLTVSQVYP